MACDNLWPKSDSGHTHDRDWLPWHRLRPANKEALALQETQWRTPPYPCKIQPSSQCSKNNLPSMIGNRLSFISWRHWFSRPFIIYIPHIIVAFLVTKIKSFYETYMPKVGVAMLVYWMIWYCYCFLSGFKCTFNCSVQYSLYYIIDIGTMWHCTLVSSNPSQTIELVLGCALFWCWLSLGAPVKISLIEFYFIMIFIMIVVNIIRIFMAIIYLLNYSLDFRYLSSSGSANAELPGCFRPWTFSLNIGLNMIPLDAFMSCLHSLLGYSTGEFQALQLIVLAAFGAVY